MKFKVFERSIKTDNKSTEKKCSSAFGHISEPDAPATRDPDAHLAFDDQFRMMCELTSDGVVITQYGLIKDCNQRFATMSGCRLEKLIETPLARLIETPAVSAAEHQDHYGDALSFNPTLFVGLDGQRAMVTVNTGTITYKGKRSEIMFIAKAADPLETEDQIQKTRKLESIAALSGGIAHDYNNLLTVIIGNISLIQSYMDSEDIIYRMLSEAFEASMIAKSLTQKLITFSKGGAPIKQTASLSPLAKSATEFTLSGSNIKCEFFIPDNLYLVEIDKTQISQAIHNLVMNAREAMPEGGTITVKAENITIPKKTRTLNKGKHVKICVTDQGIGIPAENFEKIFDPYFSTKQRGNQKGMGLGLSICHSIIEKHNGDVMVESSVGVGTTVSILLPASAEKKIEKKTAKITDEETPVPGRGRILVMDDEKMIVKLTSLILSRLGYEAEFATEGSGAIEMYKAAMESDRPYDAVILDLTVRGGMGGKETIRNLISMDPEVKGIVSSGYSDDPVMEDYQKYGFKGVVVKPFSIYELSENLNNVLVG
jgi:signal transduction histidine kinase/CheY-like chemotaxis protein